MVALAARLITELAVAAVKLRVAATVLFAASGLDVAVFACETVGVFKATDATYVVFTTVLD